MSDDREGHENRMGLALMELSTEFVQWAQGRTLCDTPTDEVFRLCGVISQLRATVAAQAAEMERLRTENQEISDQLITNGQRLGSVCDNWHNWAVEVVGKEDPSKMSGQDMRDEISRRLSKLRAFVTKVRAIREEWLGTNEALSLELGAALADLDKASKEESR